MIRPFRIRKIHTHTQPHTQTYIYWKRLYIGCRFHIELNISHKKTLVVFIRHRYHPVYKTYLYIKRKSCPFFQFFFQYRRALPPKITITLSFYMHAMLSDYVCATLTNQFSMLFTQTSSVQTKQTKKFDDFATTNRRAINKYLFKFYNILNCCDAIEWNWRTILRKNALNLFYQPERFFSSS